MLAHLDELVADVDCPSLYRVENKICHPVGMFESAYHVLEDFVVNGVESLGDVYPSGVQSPFVGRVDCDVGECVFLGPLDLSHGSHLVLGDSHRLAVENIMEFG
ncbi:TIGR04076 family protein [Babesia caballi]|uniref:TIGR04076 family protein n=1 Tax=Babesia caballi TaxID=5871 RepID=A0AAV4LN70_BABCB|nr:TIGR04076 family protein [Babesia caballi]